MVKATITDAIEDLEKASNGEEIRQALIDLIDTMNVVGGDTSLLGNHDQEYYVLEEEVKKYEEDIRRGLLTYDTIPVEGSLKVINNKNITTYFGGILEKLKKLNGDTKGRYSKADPQYIGRDIQEALNAMNNTFNQIKGAIQNQGVEIPDTDSVMDLSRRIIEIKKTTVEVNPVTITKNGFEQEEEKDPETHEIIRAWNPVTVKLELKGYEGTVTENGPATCPEGYDGWKTVKVEVDNSGSTSGGSSGSGSSGSSGSKKKGKISDDIMYNTSGIDIRTNSTFRAEDYSLDAFDSAEVYVTDYEFEDKTFKVTFVSEGETLKEIEVPMGSPAYYDGEIPVKKDISDSEFWYFRQWNPQMPTAVVADTICEAEFDYWNPNNGFPETHTNVPYINTTWEDIVSHNVNPEVGDVKLLRLTDGRYIRMRKIHGSDPGGCDSVWMSMEKVNVPIKPYTAADYEELTEIFWGAESNRTRNYLNHDMLDLIPEPVKSAICEMDKISLKAVKGSSYWTFSYESSKEKLWPLGLHEINYIKKSEKGDDSQGNYSNDILTPLHAGQYGGSVYSSFFQWFGISTPLKDQLKGMYGSYNGTSIPGSTVIARQMYPHVTMEFTIPEHTGPGGQVIPEHTYTNWDELDITTKVDFAYLEIPFDNYRIEHDERGSEFNPWLATTGTYSGYNYLNYKGLHVGSNTSNLLLLRDTLPLHDRFGDIAATEPIGFSYITPYGIPLYYDVRDDRSPNTPSIPICFGLA